MKKVVFSLSVLLIILILAGCPSPPPPVLLARFSIAASPNSVTVAAGSSTTTVVSLNRILAGFTSDVDISVTGLPTGVSIVPNSSSFSGAELTKTLTINVQGTVSPQTINAVIKAVSGTENHTADLTIKVTAPVLQTHSFSYNDVGHIFIGLDNDKVKIFLLDRLAHTAKLMDVIATPIGSSHLFKLALGAKIEAVYYAGNFFDSGNLRLDIEGETKVALPLKTDTGSLMLQLAALDCPSGASTPCALDATTSLMANLFAMQNDIIAKADDTIAKVETRVTKFQIDQLDILKDYYKWVKDSSTDGKAMLESYRATAIGMQNAFETRLNLDSAAVNTAANANYGLADYATTQTKRFEKEVFPCIEIAYNKAFEAAGGFEKSLKLDSLQETKEDLVNDRLEGLIDAYEQTIPELQLAIEKCIGTSIEDYNPDVSNLTALENLVDAGKYEDINTAGEALIATMDADIEAWQLKLEAEAQAFVDRLDPAIVTADINPIQNAFNEYMPADWIELSGEGSATNITTLGAPAPGVTCSNAPFFSIIGAYILVGTPWNDKINSYGTTDLVIALGGDDCIKTRKGIDIVFGMKGNDEIYSGKNHDFVFGGKGNDLIYGGKGKSYNVTIGPVNLNFDIGNLLVGGADNDTIYGYDGDSDVIGNGYTDVIFGDIVINGAAGKDKVYGEGGIDFIFGQEHDDYLSNEQAGAVEVDGVDYDMGSFIWGGRGNDEFLGSDGAAFPDGLGDFIFGNKDDDGGKAGSGMDFVFGNTGNDKTFGGLQGGEGIDFVFGGRGEDLIYGNEGMDLVTGYKDNDEVHGDEGIFDLVLGGRGEDKLFGGPGLLDLIFGSKDNDIIKGEKGNDIIFGGDGEDNIEGNEGLLDLIFGGKKTDTISGGNGSDLIFGNKDSDIINGDDGIDVIFGNSNTCFLEKDKEGNPVYDKRCKRITEVINGGKGLDLIFGNTGRELIHGNAGIDMIFGNKEEDQIFGDTGIDLLFGNSGKDEIHGGDHPDLIFGGTEDDLINGDDSLDIIFGNGGSDTINGNDGLDVIFGNKGEDLIHGNAGIDLIFGNEDNDRLFGDAGLDLMFGNTGVDTMNGNADLDIMFGNSDNDIMTGDAGVDFIFGSSGNDAINGSDGFDILLGNAGDDTINGNAQTDIIFGNDGADIIHGNAGIDIVFGNKGNDHVLGDEDSDLLFGNQDNDRMDAGSGNDLLFGNKGNDDICARAGRNLAFGNKGNDILDGYLNISSEARDFLFGNAGSDHLSGNHNNQKDLRIGGSGSDTKDWDTSICH